MHQVLFICTGNLCRSPIAEAILRIRWNSLGRNDLAVASMGIYAACGKPAAEAAVEICKENGLDISAHRSQPVDAAAVRSADLIFTMDIVQRRYLLLYLPGVDRIVHLLGAWPDGDNESRKAIIPDPMGGNYKAFRKTFQALSRNIERIVPFLASRFDGLQHG